LKARPHTLLRFVPARLLRIPQRLGRELAELKPIKKPNGVPGRGGPGRALPMEELLAPDTSQALRSQQRRVVHLAFGLAVPFPPA